MCFTVNGQKSLLTLGSRTIFSSQITKFMYHNVRFSCIRENFWNFISIDDSCFAQIENVHKNIHLSQYLTFLELNLKLKIFR